MCVCVCVCVCDDGVGYESLLEAIRVSQLSLLYGFFARFKDGLPLMSRAFSGYIKVNIAVNILCMNVCMYVCVCV